MFGKIGTWVAVITVLLCPFKAYAESDFDRQLQDARKLVEGKDYNQAIVVYSTIADGLRRDPGLVIEWARVYTYADRHEEAIRLFEEVRSRYPDRAKEIIRELADQYKWSGKTARAIEAYREGLLLGVKDEQLFLGLAEAYFWNDQSDEALKIYDDYLKRFPDDAKAILAKANILSLRDKLEEAYALCQKVLDKDPDNLEAQNAQARILVWQGYHRLGIAGYEKILRRYPKNPDAIEGMAFALHWLGDDISAADRLREVLEFEPNRKEAQQLYFQIKNSQRFFVRPSGRFSGDSTPQTVASGGMRTGWHLDYATSIDGLYEHQVLRKKGSPEPHISADRKGVALGRSFGYSYEFNSFLYQTHFNKVGFDPFTTGTWFTYKPDDYLRFDLAYDRETFEDNDAILRKITTNSPSLSMDFRPDRFWFFNLKYKRSYFSDDNRQNQVFGTVEYRISHKPFVKLYYNYYFSGWGEPELSHGYFNPRSIRSHALGVYTGVDISKRLFVEAKSSGGYEFQRKPDTQHKKSDHPTMYLAGSLNYRLSDNWNLSLSGDYFTTWPDHGQRSYQKKGSYLALTYNFGANPVGLHSASQPARTTGE